MAWNLWLLSITVIALGDMFTPSPRQHNSKSWKVIANNLKKAGWSLGWVSAIDSDGRTSWIADAHRGGKRYVVRADEKLTAFSLAS